ncbi:DNA recombination protein RmuC [Nocardioides sambongensis]|uniref:DNA recombination protein RmuC n=1 Tax=Nocardioides sambongensis TaxID=2589074 RepID=UPI0015E84CC9|nr:DNA recombination protein RmuC [Nocardioides sambongensis]
MEIVLLLVGVLLGAGLGILLGRVTRAADTRAHQEALRAAEAETEHHRVEVDRVRAEADREQELAAVRAEHIATEIRAQEAAARAEVESRLAAALASVEEIRGSLDAARAQHQESVRTQQHAQQQRERTEGGHQQVLKTLTPVVEQLRAMQQRVHDMEEQRHRQHGELAEQLRTTQHTVAESKKAADTLAHALSNNAVRGFWGETQLRTLVESAGLLARVDFDTQASIQADSGARRPDMVINLPGGKQMAIDAKAPYNAYIEACRSDLPPDQRHRHLVEHAKKVRGHVDTLASKSYWSGLAASPEFTIAFIPNDQLLSAALEADPSLLEHAFGKGIVLATPANLWAILKTVAFTWRQDVLTEDAQRLFDLGRELYRRIQTMAEHAEKLRRSLESTIKSYNAFAGSLESRVLVTARKLDRMDESSVIPAPATIDVTPRALTSGDFEAIADAGRHELSFDLGLDEPVDAEIVDDERRTG